VVAGGCLHDGTAADRGPDHRDVPGAGGAQRACGCQPLAGGMALVVVPGCLRVVP
jgi:hypothetical protein